MANVTAFECSRTGVLYPADYVEQWGKKYGIGLGPVPVSEALVNEYDFPIAPAKDNAKTMHPLGVCRAQIDKVIVTEEEFNSRQAIIDIDDVDMTRRSTLMRNKQLVKSSKLSSIFPDEARIAKEVLTPVKMLPES